MSHFIVLDTESGVDHDLKEIVIGVILAVPVLLIEIAFAICLVMRKRTLRNQSSPSWSDEVGADEMRVVDGQQSSVS
jgi:hypothetical protein